MRWVTRRATSAGPYAADPRSKSAIAVAQARSNFVASPFLPSGAQGVLLGTVQAGAYTRPFFSST